MVVILKTWKYNISSQEVHDSRSKIEWIIVCVGIGGRDSLWGRCQAKGKWYMLSSVRAWMGSRRSFSEKCVDILLRYIWIIILFDLLLNFTHFVLCFPPIRLSFSQSPIPMFIQFCLFLLLTLCCDRFSHHAFSVFLFWVSSLLPFVRFSGRTSRVCDQRRLRSL